MSTPCSQGGEAAAQRGEAERRAESRAAALDRDGYAIVPRLLEPAPLAALRAELVDLCRTAHRRGCASPGADVALAHFSCLQFPHLASKRFLAALLRTEILAVLREPIGAALKLAQSIVLTKPAGARGLAWHQDRHYLTKADGPLFGVWIALDDARVENGCLWVLPGSHRPAVVWPHREQPGEQTEPGPRVFDHPFVESAALPLAVGAGDCVLLDGYLLHRSLPNRCTSGFRRALIGHFTAADASSPWDGANRRVAAADGSVVEFATGAAALAVCPTVEDSREANPRTPRAAGADRY